MAITGGRKKMERQLRKLMRGLRLVQKDGAYISMEDKLCFLVDYVETRQHFTDFIP